MTRLEVAIVGCGLIGTRRAREASQHPRTHLAVVTDVDADRRDRLATEYTCRSAEHWKQVIDDGSIDVVIVSTPNGYTAEIGTAALAA